MLELQNISKKYTTGDFTQIALNDVSVSFRDNEFVAILGPSGSGKTTLLNMIGGLDHYDSGDLIIDGISTKNYKDRDWDTFRNNRIGFVFQSYNLIPHQSVLANVELALTLSGVPREERRRRAREALEKVGLGDHIAKKPSQLSGGQMQRVAIARALINDPEILLADEPTGALDSKTSTQIMDLLTEIAADRLVVMVTHNPDLANEYANRIVTLADGSIVGDTNPYNPTTEEMGLSNKVIRRSSMSFFTALSLSASNLWSKKGRTIMTVLAGSIGIIGIAAILALANGVNDYIASIEEDTLSVYPLEITSTGFDMDSLMSSFGMDTGDGGNGEGGDEEAGVIGETEMITRMLSSISSNDLASLKEYLDSGESDIDKYVNSIEYTYDITPQIFSADTTDGVHQINPDTSFAALGIGSSASSLMSMITSTDVFYEMVSDTRLVEEQYDVVAGHWPEEYNECVLVLSSSGDISDFMTYVLGLRDSNLLQDMVVSFINEEEIVIPEDDLKITYDDILNLEMKLVPSTGYYQYDEDYDVWVDKTGDEEYMKNLVDAGEDIVISGIVMPKPESSITSLSMGIYYTSALTDHIIDEAAETRIVQDQIEHPTIDVFSGESFAQIDEEESESGFDLNSLLTIDVDALSSMFQIDTSNIAGDLESLGLNMDFDLDMTSLMDDLDMSALMGDMDTSSLMDSLDMSSLMGDFDIDISDFGSALDISIDDVQLPEFDMSAIVADTASDINQDALWEASAAIIVGYLNDYDTLIAENPDVDPSDLATLVRIYLQSENAQQIMTGYISQIVDVSAMTSQIQTYVESYMTQVVNAYTEQITTAVQDQLQTALTQAMNSYVDSISAAMETQIQAAITEMATTYMATLSDTIEEQLSSALEDQMDQLTDNLSVAMDLDPEAIADAFEFNLDADELTELLMSMMSSDTTTYDSNLTKLGYADRGKPTSIDIYPIDFESKEHVVDILDSYNDRMEREGEEDKMITYTDLVGTLMSSVTDIIDMISYVLIAFVAISLVVSSIMIGIITYISVLERRKEIGILRAIGASKGNISLVFNAETIIEGLASGLFGVGLTALACIPINAIVYAVMAVPNVAQLPLEDGLILILISVVLTFIAGLIPATSASRKDPVEALRSE